MLKILTFKNKQGFSLIEVMIVTAIIGILCAMALPNFNKMRANSYRDRCIANLRMIVGAKEYWSIDTGADDTDTPTAAQVDAYIKDDIWDTGTSSLTTGHEFICPLDKSAIPTFSTSYDINDISTPPSCKWDGTHVLP